MAVCASGTRRFHAHKRAVSVLQALGKRAYALSSSESGDVTGSKQTWPDHSRATTTCQARAWLAPNSLPTTISRCRQPIPVTISAKLFKLCAAVGPCKYGHHHPHPVQRRCCPQARHGRVRRQCKGLLQRFNELRPRANNLINFVRAIPGLPDTPQAQVILDRLAAEVHPVMVKFGFRVGTFEEVRFRFICSNSYFNMIFQCQPNPTFVGRSWEDGETIGECTKYHLGGILT